MIGRLHHVVIDCPEPAALADFYSVLLGLPVTYTSDDWVVIAKNDTTSGIAFQLAPDHRPSEWRDPDHPQQFHLDVMVDDLDAGGHEVLERGASVLSAEDHIYADPAGHPFCLIPRPAWAVPIHGGTMSSDVRQRRLEVLEKHFQSEVEHDWDSCLATFGGHARYEIMATGQIHDGNVEVLAYHRSQRVAFPDQRHENVRIHVADDDDTIITEFDLLGTNTGEFYGSPPTGKSFRVPVVAVFLFDGDHIVNERVYLDGASLIRQIGQPDLLPLAGSEVSLLSPDECHEP